MTYNLYALLHDGRLRVWRLGVRSQLASADYDRAIVRRDDRFHVVRPLPSTYSDDTWCARLEDVAVFDTLAAAITYVATEHGGAPEADG